MTFSIDSRVHSEVGPVRKDNQDSAYISPTSLMIADGMGGAAAGDLASAIAVHEVARADGSYMGEAMLSRMSAVVSRANDDLADLIDTYPDLQGMGTTMCGAMFSGTELALLHIGDSRAYRLRGGELEQLTHDHSWVQSLIDEGRITESEAAVHPHRSLVLKVVNGQPQHTPDLHLVPVAEGDRYLFCSDGLSGFVNDEQLKKILTNGDLDAIVDQLSQAAHQGGGGDNISFIVSDVVPASEELDKRKPVIAGAAAHIKPPVPGSEPTGRSTHSTSQPDRYDPEADRYALSSSILRRWIPVLVAIPIILVAASILWWGSGTYLASQYYVGMHDDRVTIFNGIPGTVLGRDLADPVEVTSIMVNDLPTYYRQQVISTIRVQNLTDAEGTVEELEKRSEACIAYRETASAKPTAKPSKTATPASPSSTAASKKAPAPPLPSVPSASFSVGPGEGCG